MRIWATSLQLIKKFLVRKELEKIRGVKISIHLFFFETCTRGCSKSLLSFHCIKVALLWEMAISVLIKELSAPQILKIAWYMGFWSTLLRGSIFYFSAKKSFAHFLHLIYRKPKCTTFERLIKYMRSLVW